MTLDLPMPCHQELGFPLTDGFGVHRLAVGASLGVVKRPQAPQTNRMGIRHRHRSMTIVAQLKDRLWIHLLHWSREKG